MLNYTLKAGIIIQNQIFIFIMRNAISQILLVLIIYKQQILAISIQINVR